MGSKSIIGGIGGGVAAPIFFFALFAYLIPRPGEKCINILLNAWNILGMTRCRNISRPRNRENRGEIFFEAWNILW